VPSGGPTVPNGGLSTGFTLFWVECPRLSVGITLYGREQLSVRTSRARQSTISWRPEPSITYGLTLVQTVYHG